MRLNDAKPYSRARTAILVSIHEQAYKFKRFTKRVRGEIHSPEWKKLVYAIQEEMDWGNVEILIFINLVKDSTRKEVRQFLLENGSKIVRRGKKTYVAADKRKTKK